MWLSEMGMMCFLSLVLPQEDLNHLALFQSGTIPAEKPKDSRIIKMIDWDREVKGRRELNGIDNNNIVFGI